MDEIQGAVAIKRNLFRGGAVGFIDWLDGDRIEDALSHVKK
jgi:hypothetical protein